jgi:hypothetical protein
MGARPVLLLPLPAIHLNMFLLQQLGVEGANKLDGYGNFWGSDASYDEYWREGMTNPLPPQQLQDNAETDSDGTNKLEEYGPNSESVLEPKLENKLAAEP